MGSLSGMNDGNAFHAGQSGIGPSVNLAEQSPSPPTSLSRFRIINASAESNPVSGGQALALFAGELDFGADCVKRGLAMNPNYATGWNFSAWVHLFLGEHETSLAHVRQWERLDPRPQNEWEGKLISALAHMYLGHFEEAVSLAEQIVAGRPTFMPGWRALAVCRALAGDVASASIATKKALELDPSLTVSAMVPLIFPLRRAVDVERWREGLVRAGFPP